MTSPVRRARAQFPAIQITMISIIVALALQEWLEHLPEIEPMWEPSWLAVRLWCQALVAICIIVKMWTGFVLAAAVVERVPTAVDLLVPIGILVFVDAQIASVDVVHVARWWYVLGLGSLVAGWFIAWQRFFRLHPRPDGTIDFVQQRARTLGGPGHPAIPEFTIGILAVAIAAWHQLSPLSERALLVACAAMLLLEAASTIGPIVGWRVLRRMEAQELELESADGARAPTVPPDQPS